MNEFSFFSGIWLSFFIIALSSFGVFFSRTLKNVIISACVALGAISFQILNTDIFRSVNHGITIIFMLWLLFFFLCIAFKYALEMKATKNHFFLILPFLAFITTAISLDLITLLLGIQMFLVSFIGLQILKEKNKEIIYAFMRKVVIAFLCFSYALAYIYAREGTILLKDLYLKLNKGNWDSLTTLSIGLFTLSVMIDLYAIIPIIGKKK